MAASRGDLFQKMRGLEEEMDRLFDRFFVSKSYLGMLSENVWHPPTDVCETEDAVLVCMEIPGVHEDDIEVTFHENILTIKGRRADPCTEQKVRVHLMEINYGRFHRRLMLPFRLTQEAFAERRLASGFLHLRILKPTEVP